MKGIELCADCGYYDMKHHSCKRGCTVDPDINKGEDVRFYVDCPLPDVQPVKHGHWKKDADGIIFCSECNKEAYWDTDYEQQLFDFCPYCGADMRGDAE